MPDSPKYNFILNPSRHFKNGITALMMASVYMRLDAAAALLAAGADPTLKALVSRVMPILM